MIILTLTIANYKNIEWTENCKRTVGRRSIKRYY